MDGITYTQIKTPRGFYKRRTRQMTTTKTVKAYLAHAMTARVWSDVLAESKEATSILNAHNIGVLDPVFIEEVISDDVSDKIDNVADASGKKSWFGDKKAIRNAHVLIDITPESKSEGVLRELGYARFFLFKPVIRVYKPGSKPHMITEFEDDAIVYSLEEAGKVIHKRWGTLTKRVLWRLKMLFRSIPKFIWYQICEFK